MYLLNIHVKKMYENAYNKQRNISLKIISKYAFISSHSQGIHLISCKISQMTSMFSPQSI